MHQMEHELKDLAERGKKMEQDSEMLNMLATVAGSRTKLKALLSEAKTKKSEIEVLY